jgi:CBS domain containing-hemolysin-like protein
MSHVLENRIRLEHFFGCACPTHAVGLDIVTFLAVLELRHYLAAFARSVRIPNGVAAYVTNPALWLYACMWPLIWARAHTH